MRCSITAKQNSKGKKQWFIGYKAHLATDDGAKPSVKTGIMKNNESFYAT
jgi:hypothetical protein